jgi:hypothetical protein
MRVTIEEAISEMLLTASVIRATGKTQLALEAKKIAAPTFSPAIRILVTMPKIAPNTPWALRTFSSLTF